MNKKHLIYYIILAIIFLIGLILRLKFYISNRPLWHDECSLALSIINRNIFGFFSTLEHNQSAPPLFLLITKFFTLICNSTKEYILRLFPLICGLGSIPAFYYFSKLFISRKWVLIIANFLFAINYHIIYYCQEFKQYSSDVFVLLLCFIFLAKLNLTEYTTKKLFLLGGAIAILPILSLPSLFLIGAFIIQQIVFHKKSVIKNIIIFISPCFISCIIYYLLILSQQYTTILSTNYWDNAKGFFMLSINHNLYIISQNLAYHLYPNKFLLINLILCLIGFFYIIKNRKKTFNFILIILMIIITICSYMKLYPVYERVSLYLIPITLVLITLPLNYIAYNRKIYSIFVILLTFLGLSAYNLSYAKTLLKNDLFYKTDARTTMKVLLEQYNPSDYVIINRASDSEFEYYKHYYNIDIKHFAIVQLPEYSKENYFDILDQLPANNNYLFYYPNDYSHSPVIPFLKEWSKKQKILFDKEVNGSYLIYLHKLH